VAGRQDNVMRDVQIQHVVGRAFVTVHTRKYGGGYIILMGLACSPHPPRASPFAITTFARLRGVISLNVRRARHRTAELRKDARERCEWSEARCDPHRIVPGGPYTEENTSPSVRPSIAWRRRKLTYRTGLMSTGCSPGGSFFTRKMRCEPASRPGRSGLP
jgi:hypothetical protein